MALQIIGDRINSIDANREEELERELTIRSGAPSITAVEQKEVTAVGDKKKSLIFTYDFLVEYGKSASLKINASIIALGTSADMDDVKKQWDENKEVESDTILPILNRMMEVAVMAAVPVARELRLPPPIQIPRFKKDASKADAK